MRAIWHGTYPRLGRLRRHKILTLWQDGVPSPGKYLRCNAALAATNLEQKKFTDSVNGKSGLTFEAALASEVSSDPCLSHVQPLMIATEPKLCRH